MSIPNSTNNLIGMLNIVIKHKTKSGTAIYSILNMKILKFLYEENIISYYEVFNKEYKKYIRFSIYQYNYYYKISNIKNMYCASKHYYVNLVDLKKLSRRIDNALITTNLGLKSIRECLKDKVGGRILFYYTT